MSDAPDVVTGQDVARWDVARLLAGSAVAGAVLSLLVGWLWVQVSNPPRVPLHADGAIFLDEQALNQQSGVTFWFLMLGLAFGAAAGLTIGWRGERFGWWVVVSVVVLTAVATVSTRYLGVSVYGPSPASEAAGDRVGQLIQVDVSLGTWVAYLGWPVGGLVGVLAAISAWRRSSVPPHFPPFDR